MYSNTFLRKLCSKHRNRILLVCNKMLKCWWAKLWSIKLKVLWVTIWFSFRRGFMYLPSKCCISVLWFPWRSTAATATYSYGHSIIIMKTDYLCLCFDCLSKCFSSSQLIGQYKYLFVSFLFFTSILFTSILWFWFTWNFYPVNYIDHDVLKYKNFWKAITIKYWV